MKPGATTSPLASITCFPCSGAAEIAAIFPPRIPIERNGVQLRIGVDRAPVPDHDIVRVGLRPAWWHGKENGGDGNNKRIIAHGRPQASRIKRAHAVLQPT
jgi:hypothetical protein